MYGPIAGGLYGACQEIYPRPLEDDGLCSCGREKARGDFLCEPCRLELDDLYDRARSEGDDNGEGLA